jgi:hypothetical protein
MYYSAFTLIASVVCAAVYAAGHHEAARILTSVVSPIVAVINLIGIALFILDAFYHRKHKVWNIIFRVLDHYSAIASAWALVVLAVWMWGQRTTPNTYLVVLLASSQESVFAAWVSTLRGAFGIWLTVGSPSIQPRVTFAEVLFGVYYWLAWVLPVVFLGAIIATALARIPVERGTELVKADEWLV